VLASALSAAPKESEATEDANQLEVMEPAAEAQRPEVISLPL
jgi:hypothetical protein